MSNLLPQKWRKALEQVYDKVGHFLSRVNRGQKEGQSPERITADSLPAFMRLGGPLLDMHETSDELVVRVELPGLTKDDFSVELVGRQLTIRGEKQVMQEAKRGGGWLVSECRYGSFVRSVLVPYEIDATTLTAELKDGILVIRLPKPEKGRPVRYRVPVS